MWIIVCTSSVYPLSGSIRLASLARERETENHKPPRNRRLVAVRWFCKLLQKFYAFFTQIFANPLDFFDKMRYNKIDYRFAA